MARRPVTTEPTPTPEPVLSRRRFLGAAAAVAGAALVLEPDRAGAPRPIQTRWIGHF